MILTIKVFTVFQPPAFSRQPKEGYRIWDMGCGEGQRQLSAVAVYCFWWTGSLSPPISIGGRTSSKIPGFCGIKSKRGLRHIC